jgi:uncharacterized membrane protein
MDYKNISSLLKEYNHFIIEEDWAKSTKDHPDFPQLNSFSDIFNQYAIDNYIAQVPLDFIDDLPNVFIGLVNYKDNLETAIIRKNNNKIKLLFFDSSIEIEKSEFLKIWNGYTLIIEENENPTITHYKKKSFNSFPIILIVFLSLSFFLSNYFFNFLSLDLIFLLIINGVGLFLSFIAIKESFGFGNKHLFRVCSAIKNGNCNQVIKSSYANLFLGVTYSDLSFVFYIYSFIGTFFIFKFPLFNSLNVLFIPLIVVTILFSLYHQKYIIKKWCVLCLGISLVTILQSIVIMSLFKSNFSFEYVILGIFSFMIIFIKWYYFKPLLANYSELIFEKYQRGEIYKNKEVFNLYLERNTLISENDFSLLSFIKLNEIKSTINLTLVLSLNCEYCKSEYKKFRELMFYYDKKVQFNILFNFDLNEIEKEMLLIAENFYLLKDNPNIAMKALDDYFIKNDSPNLWLKKWRKDDNLLSNVTFNNIELLNNNNITDTPCVLINNRLYPKEYKIEDIKYFLNSLINRETDN